MVVTRESLRLKKKKDTSFTGRNEDINFNRVILTRSKKKREEKLLKENTIDILGNKNKRKSSKIEEKEGIKNRSKKIKPSKQKNNSKKVKKEKVIEPILIVSDNESNNENSFIDIENISESEDDTIEIYNLRKRKLNSNNNNNNKDSEEEKEDKEEEFELEIVSDSDFEIKKERKKKKENKKNEEIKFKNKNKKNENGGNRHKRKKISKQEFESDNDDIIIVEEEKSNDNDSKEFFDMDNKKNNKHDTSLNNNKGNNKNDILNDTSVSETVTMEDNLSEESENDEEWEEIEISTKSDISSSDKLLKDKKSITISIDESKFKKQKKKGINKQDRDFRKTLHKTQFICFIISCRIWNSWINSELIKNLALSILPDYLIYNKKTITSGNINQLSELIENLCKWFIKFFGKKNIDDVLKSNSLNLNSQKESPKKTTLKEKDKNEQATKDTLLYKDDTNTIEKKYNVKNIKILSLFFQRPHWVKHFSNSENLYIILFVLFARISGFHCRFTASLYPIPLSFSKKKLISSEAIKLWCEIYYEKEKKWIPVNPLYSTIVYKKPREYKIKCTKPINYIISMSQDGFIKDKTKFYDEKYYLSTWKLRMEEENLVFLINDLLNKGYREDILKEIIPEDEDPDKNVPFPTSIGAYVNHPLFVLEKHIKQYEILMVKEPILGYIRNEPIYPRNNVLPVSTEGHWVREGLQIKDGEKPLKFVKSKGYMLRQFRLDYLIKKNAALPKDFELGEEMVPLYGKWQTEEYKPKPVVDGIVPKSKYGNIDLFKPSMLPKGAVHLNYKGIAQVAKRLGVDYAEAVTGIDVAGHHWVPTINGIVVAKENAEKVLSRYQFFEKEKQRKIQERKEKRIYGHWRRLIKKLLTKEVLIAKYGHGKKPEIDNENDLNE